MTALPFKFGLLRLQLQGFQGAFREGGKFEIEDFLWLSDNDLLAEDTPHDFIGASQIGETLRFLTEKSQEYKILSTKVPYSL